jgi:hypothetical protein
MAAEIRCADHATPSTLKRLALTSPTSGGRSFGIVRLRTTATEFSFSLVMLIRAITFCFSSLGSLLLLYISLVRTKLKHISVVRSSLSHTDYNNRICRFWGSHSGGYEDFSLLHSDFLFGLLFDPEDGSDMFLNLAFNEIHDVRELFKLERVHRKFSTLCYNKYFRNHNSCN